MHSNDYATAQSLMVTVAASSLGATQLHFLEPGVKVNGDYYPNTVMLNMLLLDGGAENDGHEIARHEIDGPSCRA